MPVIYVTAFLDIGREGWETYSRSAAGYLRNFQPFSDYIVEPDRMVAFVDERLAPQVEALAGRAPIAVVPISLAWCEQNLFAWSRVDKERAIMESDAHKALVGHRLSCPETCRPLYTVLNHAKVDFLAKAAELAPQDPDSWLAWIDFGYFKQPELRPRVPLWPGALDAQRVNYCAVSPVDARDRDPRYTLARAPEKLCGYFWALRRELLPRYAALYHRELVAFQEEGYADDDQHLMLRCLFAEPDLFRVHTLGGWHRALLAFSPEALPRAWRVVWPLGYRPTAAEFLALYARMHPGHVDPLAQGETELCAIMNRHGSDKGDGWHNYTLVYSALFAGMRWAPISLFEIGIGSVDRGVPSNMASKAGYQPGASLRAWAEYFPRASVTGADIDPAAMVEAPRICTFVLDQKSVEQLNVVAKTHAFDVIIDDGLHHFPTNWVALKRLWPALKPGGVYVIEDIADFDEPGVAGDPFTAQLARDGAFAVYFPLPNPRNKHDNNLLIVHKPL